MCFKHDLYFLVVMTLLVFIAAAKPADQEAKPEATFEEVPQGVDQGQPASAESVASQSRAVTCYGTANADGGLEVRAQPTTKSVQVASLSNGKRVRFFDVKQGEDVGGNKWWWQVIVTDGYGWCSEKYLKDITCSY